MARKAKIEKSKKEPKSKQNIPKSNKSKPKRYQIRKIESRNNKIKLVKIIKTIGHLTFDYSMLLVKG
jgi:hypothetical protein